MSIETTAAMAAGAAASAAAVQMVKPGEALDPWLLVVCIACGLYGALKAKPGDGRAELAMFVSSVLASVVMGYVAGQAFGQFAEAQWGARAGLGDRLMGCLVALFALRLWDWASLLGLELAREVLRKWGVLPRTSGDGGNNNGGQ